MILVLRVDGQVVTHRVMAVNPDGTLVTRGDANSVDDAWSGRQITVEGQYLATVPVPGNVLHVGSTSDASFADGARGVMTIKVGPFLPPVPCPLADFGYDATGAQPYPLLTVHVSANGTLPADCALSFSLNAYTAQGPDWHIREPRPSSTTTASRSMRATRRARSRCNSRPATARSTSTPARSASTASTAPCPLPGHRRAAAAAGLVERPVHQAEGVQAVDARVRPARSLGPLRADPDADADTNRPAHAHGDTRRDPDSYANRDRDSDAHAYARRYPDAHANPDSDVRAYARADVCTLIVRPRHDRSGRSGHSGSRRTYPSRREGPPQ